VLRLSVSLTDPGKRIGVGVPLTFAVGIKNISQKATTIIYLGRHPFEFKLSYAAQGATSRGVGAVGGVTTIGYTYHNLLRLRGGEKREYRVAITPLLPGKARISVSCANSRRTASVLDTKKSGGSSVPVEIEVPDAWVGSLFTSLPVNVGGGRGLDYYERREALRITRPDLARKFDALCFGPEERNFFAARFLLEHLYELAKESPLRPIAVLQLAVMAKEGYGYEAIPRLLELAADEAEPVNIRLAAMDVLPTVFDRDVLMIHVRRNEGNYIFSQTLRNEITRTVRGLAGSDDPAIARKARSILQKETGYRPEGSSTPTAPEAAPTLSVPLPPEPRPSTPERPRSQLIAAGLAGLLLGFAAAALLFRRRRSTVRPGSRF